VTALVGQSRRACIRACIGTGMVGPLVPVADMADVFGVDAVLAVARTLGHGTPGPDVVRQIERAQGLHEKAKP
jgi:hypothetical protein